MDGYTRLCKGCAEPISVPFGRGQDKCWCSERCRQQRLRDVRVLEIYELLEEGSRASVKKARTMLEGHWHRALERESRRASREAELRAVQEAG